MSLFRTNVVSLGVLSLVFFAGCSDDEGQTAPAAMGGESNASGGKSGRGGSATMTGGADSGATGGTGAASGGNGSGGSTDPSLLCTSTDGQYFESLTAGISCGELEQSSGPKAQCDCGANKSYDQELGCTQDPECNPSIECGADSGAFICSMIPTNMVPRFASGPVVGTAFDAFDYNQPGNSPSIMITAEDSSSCSFSLSYNPGFQNPSYEPFSSSNPITVCADGRFDLSVDGWDCEGRFLPAQSLNGFTIEPFNLTFYCEKSGETSQIMASFQ